VELYVQVRRSIYVEGLSEREAARRFGIAREAVRKMLRYRIPPGYRRNKPVRRVFRSPARILPVALSLIVVSSHPPLRPSARTSYTYPNLQKTTIAPHAYWVHSRRVGWSGVGIRRLGMSGDRQ